MASLGNASLILSANGGQLQSGLQQAESQVKGFAERANSTLSGAFSSFGSLAAFGGIGAAIGAAVGVITSGFSRLQEVGQQTRTALSLGIDASQYQGLSLILQRAGIEANQVGDYFGSMAAKIQRAASTGMGPAAHALESLGLNAQQLAGLPIDQQFIAIAEAISKLPPGAEQATASLRLFGTTALLPQLAKGRAGIQEFIQGAINDGRILGSAEAEAAMQASKAWEEAKKSLINAWNSVSLTVAQAITPIISLVADVFKQVVAVVKPYVQAVGQIWSTIIEVVTPLFELFVDTVKGVFQFLGDLIGEFGGKWPPLREVVLNVLEAIGVAGSWVFDTIKAAIGVQITVWGLFVQGIGKAVDAFNAMRGVTTHFEQMGIRMRDWGIAAVASFGKSQDAVVRFFDTLRNKNQQARQDAARPIVPPAAQLQPTPEATYRSIAPLVEGTKELYSYQIRWQMDPQHIGDDPAALQREANAELRGMRGALDRIEENTGRGGLTLEAA